MRNKIIKLIENIKPFDEQEKNHIIFTKEWINSGAEIFRIAKPATPNIHLVSYFIVIDPIEQKILLVDHKKAERWLPTGGHVEYNEHPKTTVYREIQEELGINSDYILEDPFFITVCETVGKGNIHTDVSLWYLLKGDSNLNYMYDKEEFFQIKWFYPDEIPFDNADINLKRCIEKLKSINILKSQLTELFY